MNGAGLNRYSNNWERISKKLRLSHPCLLCEENDYDLKECHHIDENKRNSSKENIVVLCIECHKLVHDGKLTIPEAFKGYPISGYSVTVAHDTSSVEDWFDPKQPLKLIYPLKSEIANKFRKRHIKGFVIPGSCNIYIGLHQKDLFGVLGFQNPEHGHFDVFLKADTTPSDYKYSVDLLLYTLRTKEVQKILEDKFCRKVETAYSMCFSQHDVITRYRKHAKLIKKVPIKGGGFNLGYMFDLGTVPSLKAAKALWMQNHKIA